jgi:hypothetical protein
MSVLKAVLLLFYLGHWMTCAWHFTNKVVEIDAEQSWAQENDLENRSTWESYLLCYYLVLNVVTSVGYGDMYPVTDLERIFFIVMINSGDCLFALAFGLITQISMQKSVGDET